MDKKILEILKAVQVDIGSMHRNALALEDINRKMNIISKVHTSFEE